MRSFLRRDWSAFELEVRAGACLRRGPLFLFLLTFFRGVSAMRSPLGGATLFPDPRRQIAEVFRRYIADILQLIDEVLIGIDAE